MSCRTITRPHVWVVCQCKREACRLVYCDVCGYDDRAPGPCQGEFTGEVAERSNAPASNPGALQGVAGSNPALSSIRFATVGASW